MKKAGDEIAWLTAAFIADVVLLMICALYLCQYHRSVWPAHNVKRKVRLLYLTAGGLGFHIVFLWFLASNKGRSSSSSEVSDKHNRLYMFFYSLIQQASVMGTLYPSMVILYTCCSSFIAVSEIDHSFKFLFLCCFVVVTDCGLRAFLVLDSIFRFDLAPTLVIVEFWAFVLLIFVAFGHYIRRKLASSFYFIADILDEDRYRAGKTSSESFSKQMYALTIWWFIHILCTTISWTMGEDNHQWRSAQAWFQSVFADATLHIAVVLFLWPQRSDLNAGMSIQARLLNNPYRRGTAPEVQPLPSSMAEPPLNSRLLGEEIRSGIVRERVQESQKNAQPDQIINATHISDSYFSHRGQDSDEVDPL